MTLNYDGPSFNAVAAVAASAAAQRGQRLRPPLAHRSQMMGAPSASTTSVTASVTSGPMPSPGMSVTVCGLPSPGSGTYVIRLRAPALTNWRSSYDSEWRLKLAGSQRQCDGHRSMEGWDQSLSMGQSLRSEHHRTLRSGAGREVLGGNPRTMSNRRTVTRGQHRQHMFLRTAHWQSRTRSQSRRLLLVRTAVHAHLSLPGGDAAERSQHRAPAATGSLPSGADLQGRLTLSRSLGMDTRGSEAKRQ